MKLLLDENVPRPMLEIVRILVKLHEIAHVHELEGWSGTRDIELYARAERHGFHCVLTNRAGVLVLFRTWSTIKPAVKTNGAIAEPASTVSRNPPG